MQWNGVRPNPDRPAPLRSLMEILQQKAEPYVTEYGENQIAGSGPLWNSIVRSGTEMSPGVGDLLGAEDLQTAAQNNDWGGIGLGMLAAIPGIPSFSRGVKGEARAARGAVNAAADAAPMRYADPSSGAIEVEVLPPEPDYPIRAYHGSPHSFDRFSLDKIGTGEGAQAYGHGLYFAENEGVARQYRDQLSRHSIAAPDGRVVPNRTLNDDEAALEALNDIAVASGVPEMSRAASRHYYSYGDIMDTALQRAGWDDLPTKIRSLRDAEIDNLEKTYGSLEQIEAAREAYENAARAAEYANQNNLGRHTGSMYEVGINADPSTFLDWDRPLSEQSEAVRRALALDALPQKPDFDLAAMLALSAERSVPVHELPEYRAGEQLMDTADQRAWQTLGIDAPHWGGRPEDLPGQDFYRALGTGGVGPRILDSAPQGNVGAAQYLQERGIPGIRYLDASSRYNPAALPDNPISNEARQWLDIAQGDSAEALRQFNASNPIERFAGPERDEVRKVIEAAARRPTSNYVVFNDELVKILRKYGISGLSTTVGASALAEELDRRGQTQEF